MTSAGGAARWAVAAARWAVAAAVTSAAVACSAAAPLPDLARAEEAEKAGRDEEALAAYGEATRTCQRLRDLPRRRASCIAAHRGRAELLDRIGRRAEAADAYEAMAAAVAPTEKSSPRGRVEQEEAAARALSQAARIRLALGEEVRAYELAWLVIVDHGDSMAAQLALKMVVRDGRRRDPRQLYDALGKVFDHDSSAEIADDLLYAMADLAEHDLHDPAGALLLLDRIAADYPGGYRDDALWHGAALARAAGDSRGAADRLRRLLATREVAYLVGSYFSVWLDDAQLELGRILRDDLGDPRGAVAAFRRLPRDYPTSVLRDDALWEIAVTYDRTGAAAEACRALAELQRAWPESKHELSAAPALRAKLGCAAGAGVSRR